MVEKAERRRSENREWVILARGKAVKHWRREPFLTPEERRVFAMWGVPVRYVVTGWRDILGKKCKFKDCKRPSEQASHLIPYAKGIRDYALTPSYLWRWENLVATCKAHNRGVQWEESRIRDHVEELHRHGLGNRRDPLGTRLFTHPRGKS